MLFLGVLPMVFDFRGFTVFALVFVFLVSNFIFKHRAARLMLLIHVKYSRILW